MDFMSTYVCVHQFFSSWPLSHSGLPCLTLHVVGGASALLATDDRDFGKVRLARAILFLGRFRP